MPGLRFPPTRKMTSDITTRSRLSTLQRLSLGGSTGSKDRFTRFRNSPTRGPLAPANDLLDQPSYQYSCGLRQAVFPAPSVVNHCPHHHMPDGLAIGPGPG